MFFYDVKEDRIRIRQAGDQFEFKVVTDTKTSMLHLSSPPRWSGNKVPEDARLRLYRAHNAAQGIAKNAGLIGAPV